MHNYYRLKDLVTSINILVIGDYMIDHYMFGRCERISPEAPVPVVDIKSESITLGGAGNVVKNLSSFGILSDVLTVVGDDTAGEEMIGLLNDQKVNVEGLLKSKNRKTSKKTRIMVSNHQMIRFDNESKKDLSEDESNCIYQYLFENISKYNLVLLSDYAKGVLTPSLLQKIISLCNSNGIKTIIDPKGTDFRKYAGATIIKPNLKEASIATGIDINNSSDLEIAAIKLKTELGCESLIITLSEAGIAIFNTHLEIIPTKAKEVFDVTGAGDTVLAALGLAISVGYNVHEACIFANHAAAIVVSKVGSATATLEEILSHIENNL